MSDAGVQRAALVKEIFQRANEQGVSAMPIREGGYPTIESLQQRIVELGPSFEEMVGRVYELHLKDEVPKLKSGQRTVTIVHFDKKCVRVMGTGKTKSVLVQRWLWDRLSAGKEIVT